MEISLENLYVDIGTCEELKTLRLSLWHLFTSQGSVHIINMIPPEVVVMD